MRARYSAIVLACLSTCLASQSASSAGDLKPYSLPPAARARIEKLAASSDILILGEIHGTKEVPELAAGLLEPLAKLDYNILALEVPNQEQASLLASARGKTKRIPDFFANPSGDGRGNDQLLTLARIAVSPPFRWQIICFDESESILLEKQRLALIQKKKHTGRSDASQFTPDDGIAMWRERDASMASNVLRETKALNTTNKVLVICGNVHARITNDAQEPMLSKLWPSFAAMLKQGQPAWRVGSVNVEFKSGAFFNGGKVQTIRGRPVEHAEVRSAGQAGWSLELSLPTASPATFLSPNSHDDDAAEPQAGARK